ncbi:MAG: transporter substrate-binding domain-containing protein [Propylenella sp.]
MRFAMQVAAWIIVWMAVAASDAHSVAIKVGVRVDAAPFSYLVVGETVGLPGDSGPLHNAGYSGFIVAICDSVLNEMIMRDRELTVEVVQVNAGNRLTELRKGNIDVLCDPTTITSERVNELYGVSPPVYLSGISFVSQDPSRFINDYCGVIVGFVGGTTAEGNGVEEILSAGEFGRFTSAIRSALSGSEPDVDTFPGCDADARGKIVMPYSDHTTLAKEFCEGNVIYYVGDIEIILRSVQRNIGCKFYPAQRTYSDERYGIFTRSLESLADLKTYESVVAFERILERKLFADSAVIRGAFQAFFPGYRVSEKLRLMFLSIYGYDLR